MATDQWIAVTNTLIWTSEDAGANWTNRTIPAAGGGFTRTMTLPYHNRNTVSPRWVVFAIQTDGGTTYVVEALTSTDGVTWSSSTILSQLLADGSVNPKASCYDVDNGKWIHVVSNDNGGVHLTAYASSDGSTWTSVTAYTGYTGGGSMACNGGSAIFVFTDDVVLSDQVVRCRKTTDGGATWADVTLPAEITATSPHGSDAQIFWLHSMQAFVLVAYRYTGVGLGDFDTVVAYSQDAGATWTIHREISSPQVQVDIVYGLGFLADSYDCNASIATKYSVADDDTYVASTPDLATFTDITLPAAFSSPFPIPSIGTDISSGRLIVFGRNGSNNSIAQYTDDLSAFTACTLPSTVSKDFVVAFSVPAGGETLNCGFMDFPADSFEVDAYINGDFVEEVSDEAAAGDSGSSFVSANTNVTTSVTITDMAQYDWLLFLSDSAAFTDSVVMELSLSVTDGFNASDALVSNVNYTVLVTAVAEFSDRLMVAFTETVTDSAAAADAVTLLREALANVSETIGVTDAVTLAGSTMTVLATATVQVSDTTVTGWLVLAEDGMDASEAVVSQLVATDAVTDTMAATETLSLERTVVVVEVDTIMATDTASVQQVLTELLTDGVVLATSVSFGAEDYDAWVINTQTLGPSQYTNFPFNSFAQYRGQYYAAGDDGVYVLEGETDEGSAIAARVRTGLSNFGSGRQKRMPQAYLGYTSSGELVLKVRVTGATGEKREYWYKSTKQTADATREGRIKIGRGLKSVYWEFELCNKDGAEFELDVIQLWPMILDRRLGNA